MFVIAAYFAMDYATNKILRAISVDELSPAVQEEVIPTDSVTATASAAPTTTTTTTIKKPTTTDNQSTAQESSNPTPSPKPTYDPTVSIDKAKDVKASISLKDKTKISKILLSELSANDISLLTKLASGGLTVEKKKEAKKIILQKLSEEEYNELIQIAAKLGLSQGKSYQDSLKE